MAQFRTTADYVDAVLNRAGETSSGTSPYEADALTYLNKVHHGLISGGLVFDVTVDDDWHWARAKHPFVIELQPKQNTGTVTLTTGSDAGTFSTAPSVSLAGWYLRETGQQTIYKIISHTAAETAFDIDSFYVGTTGAKSFEAFKLDYDIIPSHLYIESTKNDRLDFIITGTTQITASLTAGAYTPTALATHVATQLQAAVTGAAGTSTMGCSYDSVTRKFTVTSDTAGSEVFKKLAATGTNVARSAWGTLGFDYTDDSATADSHISTYAIGGVSRLIAPVRAYRGAAFEKDLEILDYRKFTEDYPLWNMVEGSPTKFCIVNEGADGLLTVRINKFPSEKHKLEVPLIPVPLDLKDNAASIPLLPRKFSDILEYGAAFYILLDKQDDRAQSYAELAKSQLILMQKQYRSTLKRADKNFGELTSRLDQVSNRRLRYGYEVTQE